MPNHFPLLSLLLTITVTNLHLLSATNSPPPTAVLPLPPQPPTTLPPPSPILVPSPPPPILVPSPPPPTQPQGGEQQQNQLNNIIDALIGAGDFAGYANILSNTNPSSTNLPLSTTFFIPNNTALTAVNHFDPFMIPYHIIPQRLSFSDLLLFKPQTRLPTLLPSKTLVVTSSSPTNFTIDDSPITHPDMYVNSAVSVHGIGSVLDYTAYGGSFFEPPLGPVQIPPPPPPAGEVVGSDAACLCVEYPVVFTIVFAAFVFKIQRNPLIR